MTTASHPPLPRRVVLKLKRIVRELNKHERDWSRAWPLIDPIEGWLEGGQERWLFNAARSLSDGSNIVEIGSYKGRSTCCLGFGCYGAKKRVYAIDRFDGGPDLPRQDSLREFSENIERCGLSEYVVASVGMSSEIGKNWTKPIHLLFVDGSHQYEDVVTDFDVFFPKVVANGIVAFHDVDPKWPGVLRAWNEVVKSNLVDVGHSFSLAYGRKR